MATPENASSQSSSQHRRSAAPEPINSIFHNQMDFPSLHASASEPDALSTPLESQEPVQESPHAYPYQSTSQSIDPMATPKEATPPPSPRSRRSAAPEPYSYEYYYYSTTSSSQRSDSMSNIFPERCPFPQAASQVPRGSASPEAESSNTPTHTPWQIQAPGPKSAPRITMPEPSSPFLRLPIELRLMIYAYTPAFTLLQLSHTSPQLRHEITSYPKIMASATGIQRVTKIPEGAPIPMPFSILSISRLSGRRERKLWESTYIPAQGIPDITKYAGERKTRHTCYICLRIMPVKAFSFRVVPKVGPPPKKLLRGRCENCRAQRHRALRAKVFAEHQEWRRHQARMETLAAQTAGDPPYTPGGTAPETDSSSVQPVVGPASLETGAAAENSVIEVGHQNL
ncbi:hypothetical protein BJ508DRAFT_381682 [Ascobolus immersus RN42]|uniref:F-box domain-containing protein n=1 Tax=Ascobolus immersus RN42 TaxID=1160509 RepID=A0A3N4HHF3_ASCIM|nr:hypothetical protein BJ508DRAFT_381682 [Ascobolus immersus RN42]